MKAEHFGFNFGSPQKTFLSLPSTLETESTEPSSVGRAIVSPLLCFLGLLLRLPVMEVDAKGADKGEKWQGDDVTSPSKRRDGGDLTVASLQHLLEAQTKEIRAQNAADIDTAIGRLEAATMLKLKAVKEEGSSHAATPHQPTRCQNR